MNVYFRMDWQLELNRVKEFFGKVATIQISFCSQTIENTKVMIMGMQVQNKVSDFDRWYKTIFYGKRLESGQDF